MCKKELLLKGPHIPTEEHALARLKRSVELGELGELPELGIWSVPRYLVAFMKSETAYDEMRTATVVSVTNQSTQTNRVAVTFFRGFNDLTGHSAVFSIPPQYTADFGSRRLPHKLTVVNVWPEPELTAHEGRAIVSSERPEIGVSARVYYTAGKNDERLHAITDSKVVVYREGNSGD